jgi:hypothetical protein
MIYIGEEKEREHEKDREYARINSALPREQ